jgi:hypothetical protein
MSSSIARSSGLCILAAVVTASCADSGTSAGIDGTGVRAPSVAAAAYGRVTDFGSVWVNGVRYDTANATFTIDGRPGSQTDLGTGDIVSVTGMLDPGSVTTGVAARVVLDHAVVGPISSIGQGSVVAMGQTIDLDGATFDASISPPSTAGLSVGDAVEVSGFRNHRREIVATRIGKRAIAGEDFRTRGIVSNHYAVEKRFDVNALTVHYDSAVVTHDTLSTDVANGDLVEVVGSSLDENGALIASHVTFKTTEVIASPGDLVDIEGYVTALDPANPLAFQLAGLPVATTAATVFDGSLALDERIRVRGSLNSGGTLVANGVTTGLRVPMGGHTVDIRVFEAFSGPLPDASVNLFVQTDTVGYSYWWAHAPLRTDATGRVSASFLPDSTISIWVGGNWDFFQPCAVTLDLQSSVAIDVELVAASTLNSLDPPRPQTAREPFLTGMVFETTVAGTQPVPGAQVWASDALGDAHALTITDLRGRYFLCDLPAGTEILARKDGFMDSVLWYANRPSAQVDIELIRR